MPNRSKRYLRVTEYQPNIDIYLLCKYMIDLFLQKKQRVGNNAGRSFKYESQVSVLIANSSSILNEYPVE